MERTGVAVVGGEVSGPRLSGVVVPFSGGDWPRIWDSGLVEFEAHYMLEAGDGTPSGLHVCAIPVPGNFAESASRNSGSATSARNAGTARRRISRSVTAPG